MKTLLNIDGLSTEQKLGMLMCARYFNANDKEDLDYDMYNIIINTLEKKGYKADYIGVDENGEFYLSPDLYSERQLIFSESFATFFTIRAKAISRKAFRSLPQTTRSSLLTVHASLLHIFLKWILRSVCFPFRSMMLIRICTIHASPLATQCICFRLPLLIPMPLRQLSSLWHIRAIST